MKVRFWFVMACVFLLAAIIGFAPNSMDILTGEQPNPPLLIHAHAAAMTAWMVLICTQTALISARHQALHQRIGITLAGLGLLVLGLMVWMVVKDYLEAGIQPSIALIQAKRLGGFAVGIALAYHWRRQNPEAHKRLIFLATFAVLDAAFFRMFWLFPDFGIQPWVTMAHVWQFGLLVPFIVYDLKTRGAVHPVFLIGIPVIAAPQLLAAALW